MFVQGGFSRSVQQPVFRGNVHDPAEVARIRGYIQSHYGEREAAQADPDLMWIQDIPGSPIKMMIQGVRDFLSFERTLRGKRIPAEGQWFFRVKRYESAEAAKTAETRLREMIREEQAQAAEPPRLARFLFPQNFKRHQLLPVTDADTVYAGGQDVLLRKKIVPASEE